jgi:hypothetical protein
MKMKNVAMAGVALLAVSGAANAFTKEQSDVIAIVSLAQWSGLNDHCPGFTLMNGAMLDELKAAGLTEQDLRSEAISVERRRVLYPIVLSYTANPSGLCNSAWAQLGAHGTYRRQMLEAK